MKYEEVKMEVVNFNAEDIIATSGTPETDENETERD